jgi:S1-C subfamily serine protease
MLGYAAFIGFNYLQAPSQVSIDNLENGTVSVRAENREGTGGIIQLDGGLLVLTAAHVVGNSDSAEVTSRDGFSQTARVKSIDPVRDVAILSLRSAPAWHALPLSRSLPAPGQKVVTRCFFDSEARSGLFAGPVDDIRSGEQHVAQIDLASLLAPLATFGSLQGHNVLAFVPAEPGCSGAPLLNRDGQIIGVVLAGDDKTTIAVTTSTALP